MRVAVDAMGGDHAPREIVRGTVDAVKGLKDISQVFLVGDDAAIRSELSEYGTPLESLPSVRIVHASETVGMDESPAQAIRKKKDSSIARAVDLVKSGEADAVVSAGNTGAVVVSAQLKLRTLEGIERPAIATIMPTQKNPFVLLDAGATLDCDADLLYQFAVMGSVYSRLILGRENPVVGLLSIGGEASKGNEITKMAYQVLDGSSLNFRGNVEGHDLFRGETDVIVCDGFVGNIVLKTSESTAYAIAHWMKQEFQRNPLRKLGAMLLLGALRAMKLKMDPELYGGAPLLGVNGVCIITHGASSRRAIFHAVRVAGESVTQRLNQRITYELEQLGAAKK